MENSFIIKLYLIQSTQSLDFASLELSEFHAPKLTGLSGKRKIEYTYGRLLLKYALESHGLPDYSVIEYKKRAPVIEINRDLSIPSFSISHSKGWVGLAFCLSELELGLDIEGIKKSLSHRQAAYFCNEAQIAAAKRSVNKADYFTKLWTQKEAYFKAHDMPMLNSQTKDADFSHESGMRCAYLGNTHRLALYASCDANIDINFLRLHNNQLITENQAELAWE